MSQQVDVRSIDALVDLRNSILRFSGNTSAIIQSVDTEIRRIKEQLRQSNKRCHRAVETAQQSLVQAQRQENGDVATAQRQLRMARDASQQVDYLEKRIKGVEESYRRSAHRMWQLTQSDGQMACTFLDKKVTELQMYLSGSSGTGSFPTSSTDTPTSSHLDSSSAMSETESGQQYHGRQGIQLIDLANLPQPDGISGEQDFEDVSPETMKAGLERWLEMKPIIDSNPEVADVLYWMDKDKELGLEGENTYRAVYDAFYGNSPIRVIKKSKTDYDIANGRHRIWLAKQMGITHLPMIFVASDDADKTKDIRVAKPKAKSTKTIAKTAAAVTMRLVGAVTNPSPSPEELGMDWRDKHQKQEYVKQAEELGKENNYTFVEGSLESNDQPDKQNDD